MATINFQLEVPHGREGDFFAAMASFFTGEKVSLPVEQPKTRKTVEKAVKEQPKEVETAVADPVKEKAPEAKAAPAYTLTVIRAKAKEVAGVKGNGFIKEALESVGASSVSTIDEGKYAEFMDFLNGGSDE